MEERLRRLLIRTFKIIKKMTLKSNDIIKIKAEFVREKGEGVLLDCEEDLVWFPKKDIKFNQKEEELELPVWLYKKSFPNEPV